MKTTECPECGCGEYLNKNLVGGGIKMLDWSTTCNPILDIRHAMQLFDEPTQELRIVYTPQMYDALVVLNGGIPFYLIDYQVIEVF